MGASLQDVVVDQGIAILVTAIVAVTSIFLTGVFNRRLARKQHTYRILEKMNDWERFDQAFLRAAKIIQARRIPKMNCTEDEEDCDTLDFILNYYEFIAAAILSGEVEEELVRRVEESRMCRVYLRLIDYIFQNRVARQNETIWEHLELITFRWLTKSKVSAPDLVERLVGHPLHQNFHNERDEVRGFLMHEAQKIR